MADIKLFEQSLNSSPALTRRIAFGGAGVATENMTFTHLLAYLLANLGFLKVSSNLNDLANATTARTNLGVYSSAQVDAALAAKADEYPVAGGALSTTNTTSYTPSANYHPANKLYVDDAIDTAMDVESVVAEAIISGATTYGYLYLQKVGNVVTGILRVLSSKTATVAATYVIPAALRPAVAVNCSTRSPLTGDFNNILIGTGGAIGIMIDTIDADQAYKNVPIAYVV